MVDQGERLSILCLDNDGDAGLAGPTVRYLESRGVVEAYFMRNASVAQDEIVHEVFDIVLLDVHLGDEDPVGGLRVLVECWTRFLQVGTRVLVYSANKNATDFLKPFVRSGGPFQFVPKSGYEVVAPGKEEDASPMREPVTRQLSSRASELLSQVSLRERLEAKHTNAMLIGGRQLSVRSLVSSLAATYPASEREERIAALMHTVFSTHDRCRHLSYWFKGCGFSWSADQMYGLTPLRPYGELPEPTGSLDPLTHDPLRTLDGSPEVYQEIFAHAGRYAEADLAVLRPVLNPKSAQHLGTYISAASKWSAWDHSASTLAEELKEAHQFSLEQIRMIFERRRFGMIADPKFDADYEIVGELPLYSESGGSRSVVLCGLGDLAESISTKLTKLKATGCVCSMRLTGEVFGKPIDPTASDMPILELGLAHDGTPFASEGEVWKSFPRGHSRFRAKEYLTGYSSWEVNTADGMICTVLEGGESSTPESFGRALGLSGERWTVINLLRIPLPRFQPR